MENYRQEILNDIDESGFSFDCQESRSFYSPPHWHAALELFYCTSGCIYIKINDAITKSQPNELVLINSTRVHESWAHENSIYVRVHIMPSAMRRYVPEFEKLRFSLEFDRSDTEKSLAMTRLNAHMAELALMDAERPDGWRLQCQALLYSSVQLLVQHFSSPLVQKELDVKQEIARMRPLLDYVEEHHAEELTLDTAADYMGLNREYFCRLFKRTIGSTFLNYVNRVRISHISHDLNDTDLPIGELTDQHGFTNTKLFNQMFKEIYGCTPSEKRKRAKT